MGTYAMPVGAIPVHPMPASGASLVDIIIVLCVVVPLLSLGWDLVMREYNRGAEGA